MGKLHECRGPQGEPGFQYEADDGNRTECFTYIEGDAMSFLDAEHRLIQASRELDAARLAGPTVVGPPGT